MDYFTAINELNKSLDKLEKLENDYFKMVNYLEQVRAFKASYVFYNASFYFYIKENELYLSNLRHGMKVTLKNIGDVFINTYRYFSQTYENSKVESLLTVADNFWEPLYTTLYEYIEFIGSNYSEYRNDKDSKWVYKHNKVWL